jgi:3-methyladenine DNA glycosylase AlkC
MDLANQSNFQNFLNKANKTAKSIDYSMADTHNATKNNTT